RESVSTGGVNPGIRPFTSATMFASGSEQHPLPESLMSLRGLLRVVCPSIPLLTLSAGLVHAQGNNGGFTPMAEGNGITVLSIPSVDPDREPGSGPYPVQFTIQNANNHGVAVYVSCETTGPLTCANVSWTSGVVPKKGSQQVSLTYSTTSGSGQGSVKLIVELDVGTP